MKTTMLAAALISVVFTQFAVASPNTAAERSNIDTSQTMSAPPLFPTADQDKTSTQAELLQRIKEESLRDLASRLDTEKLLREAVSATLKSLLEVTLSATQPAALKQ